jgi:hypothetical protein
MVKIAQCRVNLNVYNPDCEITIHDPMLMSTMGHYGVENEKNQNDKIAKIKLKR